MKPKGKIPKCLLQVVGGPKPPIPAQEQAEAGAEPAEGIPNRW